MRVALGEARLRDPTGAPVPSRLGTFYIQRKAVCFFCGSECLFPSVVSHTAPCSHLLRTAPGSPNKLVPEMPPHYPSATSSHDDFMEHLLPCRRCAGLGVERPWSVQGLAR